MPAVDGVHSSLKAIQDMETACARFARALVERLPEVERELRQATDALEGRRSDLRREIATLEAEISSAEAGDDVSLQEQRLEEAREELASVQRRIRRVEEVGANYTGRAHKAEHLATDHAVRTREFLSGAANDLKAYLVKANDGALAITTSAMNLVSGKNPDELNHAEKQALRRYTAGESYEINKALRDGPGDDMAIQRAELISRAIAKLPAYVGTVFRGTIRTSDELSEFIPRNVVIQKEFTSSSARLTVAQEFENNVLFTIESKTGRPISDFSDFAHEDEILFDKGTQFKVLGRDLAGDVWHIHLEEL